MSGKEKRSTIKIYKRALMEIGAYKFHLAFIMTLGLLSAPLALLTPLPLKIVVDSVIGTEPLPGFLQNLFSNSPGVNRSYFLWLALSLLIVVSILYQIVNVANRLLRDYTGEHITLTIRSRLFSQVQRLSLIYHDSKGINDSIFRISWDAPAFRWLAIDGLIPSVNAVIMLIAMLGVIARINFSIACVAISISPILILLNRLYSRRLRQQWKEVKRIESSSLSVVQEALGAIRVVKAFGKEDYEHNRFQNQSKPYIQRRIQVGMAESTFNFFVSFTTMVGTVLVLYFGATSVLAGELSVGSLLLVMAYLTQMYGPLQTIGTQIAAQQASLASAERIFNILVEPHEVVDNPNAQKLAGLSGRVEFQNVCFAYKESHPVLENVSFDIPAGSRVGILGTTGAGKTTLMSLLMRLYDPTSGTIIIDGNDIRNYKLSDYRNQFAVVLQEPVLFSTSIRENIAYSMPTASDEDIIKAAQAANAHDFISRMPDGYDTLVGERGMSLSGGERQRIALARAFLKNAPILILDEPTSSVDVKTEALIVDALDRLMQGRTTFMIAHRLSTLQSCDLWLKLEQGRPIQVLTSFPRTINMMEAVLEKQN